MLDVAAWLHICQVWQQLGGGQDGLGVAIGGKCVLKIGMMDIRAIAECLVTIRGKMALFFNTLHFGCCLGGRDTDTPVLRLQG